MWLLVVNALLTLFCGAGLIAEILEERDWPRYFGPRFLLFAMLTWASVLLIE